MLEIQMTNFIFDKLKIEDKITSPKVYYNTLLECVIDYSLYIWADTAKGRILKILYKTVSISLMILDTKSVSFIFLATDIL